MPAHFHWQDPDAPTPSRRNLGVTVFLLSPDKSAVLMERRADSGQLGFVGGALEDGETIVETARREVREETGLEIGEPTFLGMNTDPSRIAAYPDGNVISVMSALFAATVDGEPRGSSESLELVWVPIDEVDTEGLPRTQLPLWLQAQQWRRDGVVRAL